MLSILIAITMRDLSPQLRAQGIADQEMARRVEQAVRGSGSAGKRRFREILLLALPVVGWISDRLQLRKPFSLGGTIAATILVSYFASLIGSDVSMTHLMITGR